MKILQYKVPSIACVYYTAIMINLAYKMKKRKKRETEEKKKGREKDILKGFYKLRHIC